MSDYQIGYGDLYPQLFEMPREPKQPRNHAVADDGYIEQPIVPGTDAWVEPVRHLREGMSSAREVISSKYEALRDRLGLHRFNKLPRRIGAVAAAAAVAGGVILSGGGSGPSNNEASVASPFGEDKDTIDITGAESLVDVVIQAPGVIGESPCGPKVDPVEAAERFANGEVVIKPSETALFFDTYPQVEQGHSDMMITQFGNQVIDWYIANKPVLNPDLLKEGEENSIARELMARMELDTLDEDIDIQNHQCDLETGEIFPVNNVTRLQQDEQVWTLKFTAEDMQAMEEKDISLPERAVTEGVIPEAGGLVVVAQRGPCVNPLLDRLITFFEEETTTTTSTPDTTTTSTTVPGSSTTTSTTVPGSSTTTTSTTTPGGGGGSTTTTIKHDDGDIPGPGGTTPTTVGPPSGERRDDPNTQTPTTSTTMAPGSTTPTTVEAPGASTTTTSPPATTTTTMAGSNNGTTTTTQPTGNFGG